MQRFGLDGAFDADHALGLFGTQAQAETNAVLGDHETDFAFFFLTFVGRVDHLHAMLHVEAVRFVVVDIGQVAQRVLRERGGRFDRLGTLQAWQASGAGRFQGQHRIAAQLVECRGRHKPGL